MEAPKLWFPEYAGDLICVTVEANCSDEDFNGMLAINAAAFDWLDGKMDGETYFDLLAQNGIEPIEFIQPIWELYAP